MRNKNAFKRASAIFLTICLLAGLIPMAAAAKEKKTLDFRKISDDFVTTRSTIWGNTGNAENDSPYDEGDIVRVSILLDGDSVLEAGFSTIGIGTNIRAAAYRDRLEAEQQTMTELISEEALSGEELDVVWNLTLADNLISANVPYGLVDEIAAVTGVEKVVVEPEYSLALYDVEEYDPMMATSGSMTGTAMAWQAGYTGAGSKIAVIDSGLDLAHEAFDEDAFLKSISEQASPVSLLEQKDLTEALIKQIHIYSEGMSASDLYKNAKVPFGYHYTEKTGDISHRTSEHGSHVAGIAAANRYVSDGTGGFEKALDTTFVQGVAPDAQLLIMNILGADGGIYPDDYMAAIEDAVILGADVINMSLGSSNVAGFSDAGESYNRIMDLLAEKGVVVSVSGGNDGHWSQYSMSDAKLREQLGSSLGLLYSQDVNFDTVGSPGSYVNSLTVASADNIGFTDVSLRFGVDFRIAFNENLAGADGTPYPNSSLLTLAEGGEKEYQFVYFNNTGVDAQGTSLIDASLAKGKIVLVNRGVSSFPAKHQAVAEAGGIACIVVNNTDEIMGMDLATSQAHIPCVWISRTDGEKIIAASQSAQGVENVYTGSVTVSSAITPVQGDVKDGFNISSFSAWGVPGSLQLKPEITAPGGNIYSVKGAIGNEQDHDGYENMSGTSMAAPQIAGMVAVAAQYFRENDLASLGISFRALATSLLMSTAVPIREQDGSPVSLLAQGAGLANIYAVTAAKSYILVGSDSDGKVKAELGDDPSRRGEYSFTFSINNLTNQPAIYKLSAEIFTQEIVDGAALLAQANPDDLAGDPILEEITANYLGTGTIPLEALPQFSTGDTVTVPGGGHVEVKVTLRLSGSTKARLDEMIASGVINGSYIEAFVHAVEDTGAEGETGTAHSIPMLAFYGNWTDPSMYDAGSYTDYLYGGQPLAYMNGRNSYNAFMAELLGDGEEGALVGNPLALDKEFLSQRLAMNSDHGIITRVVYNLIRNAGNGIVQVTDANTGTVYYRSAELGQNYAGYPQTTSSGAVEWTYTQWIADIGWHGTDMNGKKLRDGTRVNISLILAPEYYADADGKYNWDALTDGNVGNGELGDGAYLTVPCVIDNTEPRLLEVYVDEESSAISVTASDNHYIANMFLITADGRKELGQVQPNQIRANSRYTWTFDMSQVYGTKFIVQVEDYARNLSTYEVELDSTFSGTSGDSTILGTAITSDGTQMWWNFDADSAALTEGVVQDPVSVTALAYAGGMIYGVDNNLDLHSIDRNNLGSATFIRHLDLQGKLYDMTYDSVTDALYGLDGFGNIYKIGYLDGSVETVGQLPNGPMSLTCNGEGIFYFCNNSMYGGENGGLYSFTLDTINDPVLIGKTGYTSPMTCSMAYNPADGMIYWAYKGSFAAWGCDLNDDWVVDAGDAQILLDYLTGKNTDVNIEYADANEDNIRNTLDAHIMLQYPETYGQEYCLVKIDPTNAVSVTVSSFEYLYGQALGVVVTDDTKPRSSSTPTEVVVEPAELTMVKGNSAVLEAVVYPWNLSDRSVIWESSDEAVARVDAAGVVTALTPGNVTITARSVLDNSVSGSCEITVEIPDVTLSGVVNNANSVTGLFTWDMSAGGNWIMGHELPFGVESAALDAEGNVIYICDSFVNRWDLHKVDAATGQVQGQTLTNDLAIPLWDMAVSQGFKTADGKPMICAVYNDMFIMPLDPEDLPKRDENFLVANFPYMLAGVVSVNKTTYEESVQIGPLPWMTETVEHEAEIFYLLDTSGTIWKITMRYDAEAEKIYDIVSSETKSWSTPLKDMGVDFNGFGGNRMLCSLVLADDGRLYLSAFDDGSSKLYRFTYNEDKNTWAVDYLGDMGEEVYPAALYKAESGSSAGIALTSSSAGSEAMDEIQVMSVTADTIDAMGTHAATVPFSVTAGTPNAIGSSQVQLIGGGSDGKAYIDVVVTQCQNTRITVELDSCLTYTGFENGPLVNGQTAVVSVKDAAANSEKCIEVAFASANLVTGSVVRFNFDVDENGLAAQGLKSVSCKVKVREAGNAVYEESPQLPLPMDNFTIPVQQQNLTITGIAPAEGLVYSGAPQTGYTGIPMADGYDGAFSLTYYDASGVRLDGAPVDAGRYTLVITAEDTEAYTGDYRLEFTIGKKQLTWSTVLVEKYEGDDSEAFLTVQPTLDGIVKGDSVTVLLTDAMTEGFAQYVTPGTYYGISLVPVDGNGWNFRPSNPKNYILPQGNPTVCGVVQTVNYAKVIELRTSRNGRIYMSKNYAVTGESVVITPRADVGYAVEAVMVTDGAGNPVKVTDNGNGTYTFVMPWSPVTIEVSFRFVCGGAGCPSHNYTDVDHTAWYHEGVDYAIVNKLMGGKADGIFDPDGITTRAEMVTILYRLDGEPTVTKDVKFDDVPGGQWYSDAINWAAANEIVGGYGNGKFGPDDTITREQMAAILYHYASYKGYDMTKLADLAGYADADTVSDWAVTAMQWAVAEGIINGTSTTTLSPSGDSIRAQVATIFMRFCENIAK